MRPDCGGLVIFSGTARDHAEGRPGVHQLEYEAYEDQVVPRLRDVAGEARGRWPMVGRIALLHRVGVLEIGESCGGRRRVGAAPRRGLRGRPLLHRHAQAHGADLEARDVGRAARAGGSRHSTSSTRERGESVTAVAFLLDRRGRYRQSGRPVLYLRTAAHLARAGIDDFRREMEALAPRDGRGPSPDAGGSGDAVARDLAIDLGTANTLVYERGRGIVLNEPTVIALNTRTREVLAMGHEAWQMIGRTPGYIVAVRPLRQGAITDFDITQRMIRLLLHRVRVSRFNRPRVVICVPSAITEVERRAVTEAARRAGAADAQLIEQPMAAAIGCRAPDPRAGRQHGRRRRRRHVGDGADLARRGGGAQGGAGRQLRHRRRHPGLRPARVRHRRGGAHRRGDQGRHRLGVAGARRAQGRGAGPRSDVRAAEDGDPLAGRDPGRDRRRDHRDHRLGRRLPRARPRPSWPTTSSSRA